MELIAYSQFTDARLQISVDGKDEVKVGRDDDNTLVLPSPFVSRHHVTLRRENGSFIVENHGLNGTVINGETVAAGDRIDIVPGQEFKVGEYSLYLMDEKKPQKAGAISKRRRDPLADVMELELRIHHELLRRDRKSVV